MKKKELLNIRELIKGFDEIEDPRRPGGNFRHELAEILTIILIGVICGCDTTDEIADYAEAKEGWLRSFLKLEHGVPSLSTFERIMNVIRPSALESVYRKWVYPYIGGCLGKQIAIDGKTACGASKGRETLHTVSAWVREDSISLGQIKTVEKSNEITAIPELLDTLDIRGGVVTIDAMGCQKEIAKKIVSEEANYVLAVKKNHPDLYESIDEYYQWAVNNPIEQKHLNVWEEEDRSHGRVCVRRIMVNDEIEWYERKKEWTCLRSFIMVERIRKKEEGVSTERAYYISSMEANAKKFASLIRGHWSVENNLHWMLDVAFREDDCQTHGVNAAQNLSLLRKVAYALLKNETSSSASIKRKRKKAAYDNDYTSTILRLLNPV